jgi:hypothetical protein
MGKIPDAAFIPGENSGARENSIKSKFRGLKK